MQESSDTRPGSALTGEGRSRFRQAWLREVREGLSLRPKVLPGPAQADARTFELQDAARTTEEHYATRLEMELLRLHGRQVADLVGEGAHVVDLGSDNTLKARLLLASLVAPLSYMPIDHSSPRLWSLAMQMQLDFPHVLVRPLSADYRRISALPDDGAMGAGTRALFLALGGVLADLNPVASAQVLRRLGGASGGSLLLAGIDLAKDPAVLETAYDDATGFTAELGRYLLARVNRELGADFEPSAYAHDVRYNAVASRVEVGLKSQKRQTVHVAGEPVRFERGELVVIRCHYKYTEGQFQRLARRAGFHPLKVWTDPHRWYSLHLLASIGYLH